MDGGKPGSLKVSEGLKYLSYRQRLQIETLHKVHTPVRRIAELVGCCRATVYNELKRGTVQLLDSELRSYTSYSADVSQQKHDLAQTAKGCPLKIGNDHAFASYLEYCIREKRYSPAAALAAARRSGRFKTDVCVNTLYSYIYGGVLGLDISNLVYGRRKRRKKQDALKPSPVLEAPGIDDRPQEINRRSELGHWEMDCVCGKHGSRPALLVLTERASRYELIFKLQDKKMSSVVNVLDDLERTVGTSFPEIFRSITVDNGSEFRDYTGMTRSIHGGARTEVYYCHPYRSGERGTNENSNRIIRRFIPKGLDIGKVTDAQVKHIQDWMNSYPRKVLNWRCPADLMRIGSSAARL